MASLFEVLGSAIQMTKKEAEEAAQQKANVMKTTVYLIECTPHNQTTPHWYMIIEAQYSEIHANDINPLSIGSWKGNWSNRGFYKLHGTYIPVV